MVLPLFRRSFLPFFSFFIFFALALFVQFSSPWLVGYDAYFHIKYAWLHWKDFFIEELPWLWHTIHREEYRNHHLLFHYLLMPFTLGDLMLGGKIASAFFLAGAWFMFYLILRTAGVPLALLWSLVGFLSSHTFVFRLSMLRIQSVALFFLLALFYFNMKKNFKAVFILSLLFVYLYDGFPLALFIAGSFTLAEYLTERRFERGYLLSTGAGIITGMVVNPYFPENISSFFFNIYRTLFLKEEGIRLGIEWYPYTTWGVLEKMLLAFVALTLLFLFLPFRGRIRKEEFASLIILVGFLFLLFKSRRFIEYAPAFVMLSFSLVVVRNISLKYALPLLLLFLPFSLFHLDKAREDVKRSPSPLKYKGAALWLRENSSEGDLVFNADWDDFPFLFFYNHKNYYTVGLDPMYMYRYDRKLYRLYQRITKGKIKKPGRLIKERFRAKYVYTDKKHRKFIRALRKDPWVEKVYEDRYSVVYRVRELPREYQEPPPRKESSQDKPRRI